MSLKLKIPNAKLHVYYRRNREFKSETIRMCPLIDTFWAVQAGGSVPLDAFHRGSERFGHVPSDAWERSGAGEPDFVLTPSMMELDRLGSFDPLARFVVPPEDAVNADALLRRRGLDPDNWFCTLHYREPSYDKRPGRTHRDIDPDTALRATRFVIERLGGQVVRLGHRGMTAFPEMKGFVDLSGEDRPLMPQAYAVSRSRFFLEVSPSGPLGLAIGFGVPMARCNTNRPSGPPDSRSIVMMQHLIGPNGDRIPQDMALERGLLDETIVDKVLAKHGYRLQQNSIAEIEAATRAIFERTADCPAWREQPSEPPKASGETPGGTTISWPPPIVRRYSYVEYPHLMND